MTNIPNAIYTDLSNARYHAIIDSWSSTQLKYLYSNSPKHFKAKYIDGTIENKKTSAALTLGSLVHALVLTPEIVDEEFFFMPTLRTSGVGMKAENLVIKDRARGMAEGREIVEEKIAVEARAIANSVLANEQAMKLLENTQREVSYFWNCPLTGIRFRSRVDAVSKTRLIELKTTRSAKPSEFERQAYTLSYDLSAAHYLEGLKQNGLEIKEMSFITVETSAPYVVQCYEVSEEFLEVGKSKWLEAVHSLDCGLNKKSWSGYTDAKVEEYPMLYPPVWAAKRIDMEGTGNV